MALQDATGVLLMWIGLAAAVGLLARTFGRSAGLWAGLSLIATPILGGIALVVAELSQSARRGDR